MLEIKNLRKDYGKYTAVNNLNLTVEKGEIFGFVGPNGAGKTSTMKIIAGLMPATSGEVYVDGIDALNESRKVKEKIGYMPDFFGVYDNLKVIEYLEFYASIYGINGAESKKVCGDLLELVDLTSKENAYVDSLSRGMKQRLCLARSLVHNPELLILDEPASGMDPRARFEMKEILRSLKDMGKTIIISSHILPELAELCTTIGIIEKGSFVIRGTVEEIMLNVYNSRPLKIKVLSKLEEAAAVLKEIPKVDRISAEGSTLSVAYSGTEEEMSKLLATLISKNISVVSFGQSEGNLEEIFMKVTEKAEEA
ncbi:ABC transporter ATP-binding protein [Clostridium sp. YIM B02515]|uniref:ABC transporter ATP-binding protein n=1 Tax=Clostridium rhizosphaerae TaxID=2803861 RepID=A0ABS1TEJ0_9CLOT|nr:ABC transporter ATP-binding protein [Clostridium rhizosphaerae]MBL4937705.1 ABC transporter ATP-binding protein [Clostridium rhizosphaerae]